MCYRVLHTFQDALQHAVQFYIRSTCFTACGNVTVVQTTVGFEHSVLIAIETT